MLEQQRKHHAPDSFCKNIGEYLEKVVVARKHLLLSVRPQATVQRRPSPSAGLLEGRLHFTHLLELWLLQGSRWFSRLCLLGIITDGTVLDQQNLDHHYFKRASIPPPPTLFVQHVFQFCFINRSYNRHIRVKYSFTSRFLNKWEQRSGLCLWK